jgi:hypothetical protein
MMMHPEITVMNARERHRQMLATADRCRQAKLVCDEARAARRAGRLARHDSGVRGLQRVKVLLRGVWWWRCG